MCIIRERERKRGGVIRLDLYNAFPERKHLITTTATKIMIWKEIKMSVENTNTVKDRETETVRESRNGSLGGWVEKAGALGS